MIYESAMGLTPRVRRESQEPERRAPFHHNPGSVACTGLRVYTSARVWKSYPKTDTRAASAVGVVDAPVMLGRFCVFIQLFRKQTPALGQSEKHGEPTKESEVHGVMETQIDRERERRRCSRVRAHAVILGSSSLEFRLPSDYMMVYSKQRQSVLRRLPGRVYLPRFGKLQ